LALKNSKANPYRYRDLNQKYCNLRTEILPNHDLLNEIFTEFLIRQMVYLPKIQIVEWLFFKKYYMLNDLFYQKHTISWIQDLSITRSLFYC